MSLTVGDRVLVTAGLYTGYCGTVSGDMFFARDNVVEVDVLLVRFDRPTRLFDWVERSNCVSMQPKRPAARETQRPDTE